MILMIDNYDSFTYNIVQIFAEAGYEVGVRRNDQIDLPSINSLNPKAIVISPGPGNPQGAGISLDVVRNFSGKLPLLGICLGHQCLAECFGGKIVRAKRIMHGKTSMMHHHAKGIYADLPSPFEATRYHSLIVDPDSLSQDFEITSWTEENEIMGLKHLPTGALGVQFHPESILSTRGPELLRNFAKQI